MKKTTIIGGGFAGLSTAAQLAKRGYNVSIIEKNFSHEFKSSEIFKASDLMVDSLTQLIARVRKKK